MPQPVTQLTDADDGKTIKLHVGDTLILSLHENATTGYRWSFDSLDTTVLSAPEDDYTGNSQMVGSGGETKWTLKAIKEGTTRIKLKLWREWEGNSSVQKSFAVEVNILR